MGGVKALAAATSSPSKFSEQVALSKLLALFPLSKFSKQVLSASCPEQVVGAIPLSKFSQQVALSKLLLARFPLSKFPQQVALSK